ncbi:GNAT family N-acetyltransferase [Streptomyces sp. DSM 118878]
MLLMGGDRVEEAVAHAAKVLRTVVDRDWDGPAGGLEWSCLKTAEHTASCLVAYAGQLTGRAAGDWVPFEVSLDEGSGPGDAVRVIEATGGLLASVVRTTPGGVRGFHPYPCGSADAAGFAAMASAELLLHTYDIASSLGADAEPPAPLTEAVLAHLFPHVPPAASGASPWEVLLWATGRGELPGRARRTAWQWHNAASLDAGPLALRELSPAAAADLAEGGTGGLTWIEGGPFEGTRGAAGKLVKGYVSGVHRPGFGIYAIVRTADETAVGAIGFHGPPDDEGSVEIGYDLAEAARGRGYATVALRALADWALARPDVTSLLAQVEPRNLPSQAVLTRVGFTPLPPREPNLAYGLR